MISATVPYVLCVYCRHSVDFCLFYVPPLLLRKTIPYTSPSLCLAVNNNALELHMMLFTSKAEIIFTILKI